MKLLPHILLLIASLMFTGCVREVRQQELADLVARYEMNTVVTSVFYTGSDETHDYFHLDNPIGRNRAVKVRRDDIMLDRRFPLTRDKAVWVLYRPKIATIPDEGPLAITVEYGVDDEEAEPENSECLPECK